MSYRMRVKELRWVKAGELLDHPDNWRIHTKAQTSALQAVMKEIGVTDAVRAYEEPDGRLRLFDGHLRKDILRDELVPVLVNDLTEKEARASLATFDPIGAMAQADTDILGALLDEMRGAFDGLDALADAVGDAEGVEAAVPEPSGEDPGAQIDKAEELLAKWQVRRGDIWQIGRHRLMCGDSTSAEDVAALMGGELADMCFTDPPYNIVGTTSGADDGSGLHVIRPFFTGFVMALTPNMKRHAHAYICCDFRTYPMIYGVCMEHNLHIKNCIVWHKHDGGLGAFFQNSHEFIAFTTLHAKHRVSAKETGARTVNGIPNVWKISPATYSSKAYEEIPHSAQKPVALVEKAIEASTDADAHVLDVFNGSGTTLVACEQTGRRGYGMEIEPKYCAVTLERLAGMGLEPVRVSGDGHGA